MKTKQGRMKRVCGSVSTVVLGAGILFCTVCSAVAQGAGALDPGMQKELRQLQKQVGEQGKRIDRLYNALEPHLAEWEERAARQAKQRKEDADLIMKQVCRVEDEQFTSKLIFVPGTSELALAYGDRTIRIVSLPEGKSEATLTGLDSPVECLASSSDGRNLFAGTRGGSVFRWTDRQNPPKKVCSSGDWPVTALAVAPDCSQVAWVSHGKYGTGREWTKPDESLVMVDADTGAKRWGAVAGRADYCAVSIAGDAQILALVQSRKVGLYGVPTGARLHELEHQERRSGPLSTVLSRDGKLCAVGYAPHGVGIWDTAEGRCLRLIKAHGNWVVSLAFSPDGSLLASSAGDSTARVWQVATGKELGRIRFGSGPAYIRNVSISDDGRWLAAGRRGEFVVLEMPEIP